MTAETQLYYQHPLNSGLNVKCFRDQDSYSSNTSVRPSTLLKLSEHIRSKYSLNLLKGKTVADSRTKRKIKILPYTSAFRPSITTPTTPSPINNTNFWFPPKPTLTTTSPTIKLPPTKQEQTKRSKSSSSQYSPPTPPPPGQKVYYVSGLELLSWVSSKVDRLEVPHKSDVKQR